MYYVGLVDSLAVNTGKEESFTITDTNLSAGTTKCTGT